MTSTKAFALLAAALVLAACGSSTDGAAPASSAPTGAGTMAKGMKNEGAAPAVNVDPASTSTPAAAPATPSPSASTTSAAPDATATAVSTTAPTPVAPTPTASPPVSVPAPAAPAAKPICSGSGGNILVVDDYATMRRIIRVLLVQLRLSCVDEASDGNEAMSMLRSGQFALVISDWSMEPMTGLQFLREVRADTQLKTIPFIMVTAESRSENVAAAREAGVSNYIVKPFNAQSLGRAISAAGVPLP